MLTAAKIDAMPAKARELWESIPNDRYVSALDLQAAARKEGEIVTVDSIMHQLHRLRKDGFLEGHDKKANGADSPAGWYFRRIDPQVRRRPALMGVAAPVKEDVEETDTNQSGVDEVGGDQDPARNRFADDLVNLSERALRMAETLDSMSKWVREKTPKRGYIQGLEKENAEMKEELAKLKAFKETMKQIMKD